ncbi:MAG: RNA polymerase sigma factor, partial [Acidimicrobiia bacterium]
QQLARFAFMLSGSHEIAEDAVAETYARLWPRFRRGRIHKVLPHLVRDVIVEVRERTRREGSRSTVPRAPDDIETPWGALQHLPIEQRSALVLHVVEGLSLDESAMLLGDPVDITATRVDAGLGRIAELLVGGGAHA